MQVPVNFEVLIAVSSPDELRDWIVAASPSDQDAFMECYLGKLLSGDIAVTPSADLWQIAHRFCVDHKKQLIQVLERNPSNAAIGKLVARYENYIQMLCQMIEEMTQKRGPSAADTAKVAGTAAAAAIAAPLAANAATVGVVSALGFQAGGIAAGSTAASMMGAAAAANGGGVAAGSAVAVMQSIGATGLAFGPVGWVALGVAGAAVGTVVGIKYMMGESEADKAKADGSEPTH